MCQNRAVNPQPSPLTIQDHSRDTAGMKYVYPVVSRRAGGVSVGINLNPNNACNWRCIYCQVPDLQRGGAPGIDLSLLETELRSLLGQILEGDFMVRRVPEGLRTLHDIALSGNGEPTSAKAFPEVIQRLGTIYEDLDLIKRGVKLVLITNGSLAHRPGVQAGLKTMARLKGEVWFKFDRATAPGMARVNDTETTPEQHLSRLKTVAALCPTWLQTCMFQLDGQPPAEAEIQAYLELLERCRAEQVPVQGVLLYGLARPSLQPEASRLTPVSAAWLEHLGKDIEARGFRVIVTP